MKLATRTFALNGHGLPRLNRRYFLPTTILAGNRTPQRVKRGANNRGRRLSVSEKSTRPIVALESRQEEEMEGGAKTGKGEWSRGVRVLIMKPRRPARASARGKKRDRKRPRRKREREKGSFVLVVGFHESPRAKQKGKRLH